MAPNRSAVYLFKLATQCTINAFHKKQVQRTIESKIKKVKNVPPAVDEDISPNPASPILAQHVRTCSKTSYRTASPWNIECTGDNWGQPSETLCLEGEGSEFCPLNSKIRNFYNLRPNDQRESLPLNGHFAAKGHFIQCLSGPTAKRMRGRYNS